MTTLSKYPEDLVGTDLGPHHFRDVSLFLLSTGALAGVTIGVVTLVAKLIEVAQFLVG